MRQSHLLAARLITVTISVSMLALVACAGIGVPRRIGKTPVDVVSDRVAVFAFRDPSFDRERFPGVGGRITHAFANAAAPLGVVAIPVFTKQFRSDTEINMADALRYAVSQGARLVVTGEVTKWVDRATEWSGKRDFAALSVTVRDSVTGQVKASVVVEQHSNIFWSGTPDDYVQSVAERAVHELFSSGSSQIRVGSGNGRKAEKAGQEG
jgi:hypothetical protein